MKIRVAKEFTSYVGGRYKKYGPKSGEELRDDKLIPLLQKKPDEKLTVDMTDVLICWATLEEVFGGLVRKQGPQIVERIEVISEDDPVIPEYAVKFMKEQAEHYGQQGWT